MRRRILASLTFVAGALTLAAPAHAYVRARSVDGEHPVIWPDPRITMTIRSGGAAIVPADDFVVTALRSAATWSDLALGTSVDLTIVHSADPPVGAAFDMENTISFRADSWDPPMYNRGELALTTIWVKGGRIVDTDVEFNAVDPTIRWALLSDDPVAAALSPDVDLQNALTHELGHVLGLDHPCFLGAAAPDREADDQGRAVPSCADPALPDDVRGATMYPSAARGTIGERTLSSDELLALSELYPVGHAPIVEGNPPAADGGCAVAGEAKLGSGGAAITCLALLAALASRRRTALPALRHEPRGA